MDIESSDIKFKVLPRYTKEDAFDGYKNILKNIIILSRTLIFFTILIDVILDIHPLILKYGLKAYLSNKYIIIPYLVFIIIAWQLPRIFKIIIKNQIVLNKDTSLKLYFYDNYFSSHRISDNIDSTCKFNYSEVKTIYETDNNFILKLKKISLLTIVPKNSFVIGEPKEFKEFLEISFSNIYKKK